MAASTIRTAALISLFTFLPNVIIGCVATDTQRIGQAHAATQSAPQSSSPKQWKGLLPRRSASAPISPTRAGGKGAGAGPPASTIWLTFSDDRLEERFTRWQAASLARVDCWAVLVALLHLAFLGTHSLIQDVHSNGMPSLRSFATLLRA